MDHQDFEFIQESIGYTFKNVDLLQQAFVRRSYAKENDGGDNEVLEFIGDKVLDLCVVNLLTDTYGYYSSACDSFDYNEDFDEFLCVHREGKLTEIKKHLVERRMLAQRIDELDFAQFLIMGHGDIKNRVDRQASVKEDLFEAILGAVALDSSWNLPVLEDVTASMLGPASELDCPHDENYVALIQEWTQKEYGELPRYIYSSSYSSHSKSELSSAARTALSRTYWGMVDSSHKSEGYYSYLHLGDLDITLIGFGASQREARRDVCEFAYDYLDKNDRLYTIQDEIECPCREQAINQLETLARRGYFSLPAYDFELKHDDDGNPVWVCRCCIAEYDDCYWAESSSKKDAKKDAAFSMLQYVME